MSGVGTVVTFIKKPVHCPDLTNCQSYFMIMTEGDSRVQIFDPFVGNIKCQQLQQFYAKCSWLCTRVLVWFAQDYSCPLQ